MRGGCFRDSPRPKRGCWSLSWPYLDILENVVQPVTDRLKANFWNKQFATPDLSVLHFYVVYVRLCIIYKCEV